MDHHSGSEITDYAGKCAGCRRRRRKVRRAKGEHASVRQNGSRQGRSVDLNSVLAAVVIVPALLFAAAAYYDRTQLFYAAERDASSAAAFSREHVRKAIETLELLIRELDRRVQGMTWDQIHASAVELSAEIQTMHAGLPQVSVMGVTDTEGRALSGSQTFGPNGYLVVGQREYWTEQRDADRGASISEPFVGSVTGRLNFAISRRCTSSSISFDGTVHVAVASSYFLDFWSEATKERIGVAVALVRADGSFGAFSSNS